MPYMQNISLLISCIYIFDIYGLGKQNNISEDFDRASGMEVLNPCLEVQSLPDLPDWMGSGG